MGYRFLGDYEPQKGKKKNGAQTAPRSGNSANPFAANQKKPSARATGAAQTAQNVRTSRGTALGGSAVTPVQMLKPTAPKLTKVSTPVQKTTQVQGQQLKLPNIQAFGASMPTTRKQTAVKQTAEKQEAAKQTRKQAEIPEVRAFGAGDYSAGAKKLDGFFARAGKTVLGGSKSALASNMDAMGAAYEAGQGQRTRINEAELREAQWAVARAKRDYDLDRSQTSKIALDAALTKMKALSTVLGTGAYEQALTAAYDAAAKIGTSKDLSALYNSLGKVNVDASTGVQQRATEAARDLAMGVQASGGKDIEAAKKGLGKFGQIVVDAGASGVQMGIDTLLNTAMGTPGSKLPFAFRAFGGATQQARADGADLKGQLLYGGAVAAKEVATEMLFNIALPFAKAYGGGALDDIVQSGIRNAVDKLGKTEAGKRALNTLLQVAASGVSEGLEEFIGDWMEWQMPRLYGGEVSSAGETLANALYDFAVGGLSGIGGAAVTPATYQLRMPQLTTYEQKRMDTSSPTGGRHAPNIVFRDDVSISNPSVSQAQKSVNRLKMPQLVDEQGRTYEQRQAEETQYSIRNTRTMPWNTQINSYFSGKLKSSDSLYLGTTGTDAASKLGVVDAPLYLPTSVITKAERDSRGSRSAHSLERGDILALDEELRNSAAVVYNPTRQSMVYLTTGKVSGKPLVVTAQVNTNLFGENAHKVTSIHNRESVAGLLQNLGTDAVVLIKNNSELNRLLPSTEIQSLQLLANVELANNTVPQAQESVNRLKMPRLTDEQGRTYEERVAWQQIPEAQRAAFDEAQRIAQRFGARVVVSQQEGVNGSYRDGVISLNPYAVNPVRQTLIHELTHHMESSGLYGAFRDMALRYVAENMGADVDSVRQAVMADYARNGVALDEDGATREIVAKFAEEKLFTDETTVRRLLAEDRNLFQRIYDWIRDMAGRLTGTSEESFLRSAEKLYAKALRETTAETGRRTAQYSFEQQPIPTWEQLGEKPDMQIVDIRENGLKLPYAVERNRILNSEEIQSLYRNPPVNKDTGELIFVTPATLTHSFSNSGENSIYATKHLREILENAVLTYAEPSRKTDDNSTGVYTLFGAVQTETGIQPVKIKVKEYRIGSSVPKQTIADYFAKEGVVDPYAYAYDERVLALESIEKEEPSSSATANTEQSPPLSHPSSSSTIRVQDLLRLVNSEYQKYVPDGTAFKFADTNSNAAQELSRGVAFSSSLADTTSAASGTSIPNNRGNVNTEQYSTGRGLDDITADEDADRGLRMPQLTDEQGRTYEQRVAAQTFNSETKSDAVGVLSLLRSNIKTLHEMQPVTRVTGSEVEQSGKATDRVYNFFRSIGGKVRREGFGDVLFSKSRVRNSVVGHGTGEAKIQLAAAVPSVIEHGAEINYTPNWKGRGYDSYVFAAPVDYNGAETYVVAIVTRDNANRYYLHEALDGEGNLIYKKPEGSNVASDSPTAEPQNTIADIEPSIDTTIPQGQEGVNTQGMQNGGEYAANALRMPQLTTYEERTRARAEEGTSVARDRVRQMDAMNDAATERAREQQTQQEQQGREMPEALKKLGVEPFGSEADYAGIDNLAQEMRWNGSARKQTQRQMNKIPATEKERTFARRLADGTLDAADIPNTVNRETVETLADFYRTLDSAPETMLLRQRRAIIMEREEAKMEPLLGMDVAYDEGGLRTNGKGDRKNSGRIAKQTSTLRRNLQTPARICATEWGPEHGKKVYEALFYPVTENNGRQIDWVNSMLDRVRTFKDSKGEERPLNRKERELVQKIVEHQGADNRVRQFAEQYNNARQNMEKATQERAAAKGVTVEEYLRQQGVIQPDKEKQIRELSLEFWRKRKNGELEHVSRTTYLMESDPEIAAYLQEKKAARKRMYEKVLAGEITSQSAMTYIQTAIDGNERARNYLNWLGVDWQTRGKEYYSQKAIFERYTSGEKTDEYKKIKKDWQNAQNLKSFLSAAENVQNGASAEDAAKMFGIDPSYQEYQDLQNYETYLKALEDLHDSKSADDMAVGKAVDAYSKLYKELYDGINSFLVAHGYQPIGFIEGYAPHMQPEAEKTAFSKALKLLGLDDTAMSLPTSISGKTADLKPYKQYNPFFQERHGVNTEYDIAKGFEEYVYYLGNIFYHTDDIMRIRTAEKYIRKTYSSEEASEQISRAESARDFTDDQIMDFLRMSGVVQKGTELASGDARVFLEDYIGKLYDQIGNITRYSEMAKYLDNYANRLAGKQNMADRGAEAATGRGSLNWINTLTGKYGGAKLAFNFSSALNQTSQLPMVAVENGEGITARAIGDFFKSKKDRIAFVQESNFLKGKKGIDWLLGAETGWEKFKEKGFTLIEMVDSFTSYVAVRSKYLKEIKAGKSHAEAIKLADEYGRNVMGSRARGEKPMLFDTKNPFWQIVTRFQLEALNSWEHVSRDLPNEVRQMARDKGKAYAAGTMGVRVVKYLLYGFLLNLGVGALSGGSPVPYDVIGSVMEALGKSMGLSKLALAGKLVDNVLEAIFDKRLFGTDGDDDDDAEKDWWAFLESLWGDVANDIPVVGQLAALAGVGDETLPVTDLSKVGDFAKFVKNNGVFSGDTLDKGLTAAGEFFYAGNQLRKTIQGGKAVAQGGVYSKGKLRYQVDQTPWNIAKGVLFGRSALNESQAYYAERTSDFSEKQTEAFRQMQDRGVSAKASYDLLQELRGIEKTEESTKAERQRDALRQSSVSGAGKWVTYYQTMASEKEWKTMDAMQYNSEADYGTVTNLLMDMKERDNDADKMRLIDRSRLTDSQKAFLYKRLVAEDEDLEKIHALKDAGISDYQYFQYKIATSGLSKKEAKLHAINTLDLTNSQKDALYYMNSYASSKHWEAPWEQGISAMGSDFMLTIMQLSETDDGEDTPKWQQSLNEYMDDAGRVPFPTFVGETQLTIGTVPFPKFKGIDEAEGYVPFPDFGV